MCKSVIPDDAHWQAGDEWLVPFVREMIICRDNSGEEVLVRAEEVPLFHACLGALHLDDDGRAQIFLPVGPVDVIVSRRRSHLGEVVPVEVVMDIDKGGVGRKSIPEFQLKFASPPKTAQFLLVDLDAAAGRGGVRRNDGETAQRVGGEHASSFVNPLLL